MGEGLGLWLRRTREVRKLTLDDAERALRIRKRYLQALEMGDFAALPGEIQARGFLRNYARFLDLSAEEALARYDAEREGRPMQPLTRAIVDGAQSKAQERPSAFPGLPSEEEVTKPAVILPGGLLQVLLIALVFFAVITLGGYLYLTFVGDGSGAVTATPAATQAVTAVPALTLPPTPVFQPAADGRISVRLVPEEHAWIRVSSDESIVFEGFAEPDQALQTSAAGQVTVSTGNGGAFHLYVNEVDWGLLGGQGQVVRRAWSPAGEVDLGTP